MNVPVGDAWLQALPAGEPIGPLVLPGTGGASRALRGARIGQVLQVRTQDRGVQYYLVGAQELLPVSELQAQIQQAHGAAVTMVDPNVATAAPKAAPSPTTMTQPPSSVPAFLRPRESETVVCAAYQDGSFAPMVLVDSAIPEGGGVPTGGVGPAGTVLADRVWLPPGRAALVEPLPSPEAPTGPLYLVTDVGRRYAIRSSEVARWLGLGAAHVSRLPASLLARVPEGPALDPDAARAALQQESTDSS